MELTKANKKRIIFGEAAFAVTKVSFSVKRIRPGQESVRTFAAASKEKSSAFACAICVNRLPQSEICNLK